MTPRCEEDCRSASSGAAKEPSSLEQISNSNSNARSISVDAVTVTGLPIAFAHVDEGLQVRLCGVVLVDSEEVLHQILLVPDIVRRVGAYKKSALTYLGSGWEVFVAPEQLAHPMIQQRGPTHTKATSMITYIHFYTHSDGILKWCATI